MRIRTKSDTFFAEFEKSAANILEAARVFQQITREYSRAPELARQLKELEHTGDTITHETLEKLDRTFITPIDREDIHNLIVTLDDVMDFIDDGADRMVSYGVKEPTADIRVMADILLNCTETLARVMTHFRDFKKRSLIEEQCIEIHRLENLGDEAISSAMVHLFRDAKDPIEVIKWKDIYENIESAVDACEDVSNVIRGVMVKHA